MKPETRWQDLVHVLLGILLFLSPFIMGYYGTEGMATGHAFTLGLVVTVVGLMAVYRFHVVEEWINLVLGVWLIFAPFILGFATLMPALWTHVILGLLIGGDAVWIMLHKPPQMPTPA
jgi:hypothetical protein